MSEEKDLHYFKFYYQKINNSTIGWRDEEYGAFVRFLTRQFDKGFIPDDPEELALLSTSFKKTWGRVGKKFKSTEIPGQLKNSFMITVRDKALSKSVKNSENGKEGGRGKKKGSGLNYESESKANAFRNESHATGVVVNGCDLETEEGVKKFPPIGIERVAEVAGEVLKNQRWAENTCMGQQLTPEALRKWMAQFNTSICNDTMADFDQSKYQKLFGGWLNRQKAKGYSLQSVPMSNSGAPPLKPIN